MRSSERFDPGEATARALIFIRMMGTECHVTAMVLNHTLGSAAFRRYVGVGPPVAAFPHKCSEELATILVCDRCGAENPRNRVRAVQARDIFVRFITGASCSVQAMDLDIDRKLGPPVHVTSPETLRRLAPPNDSRNEPSAAAHAVRDEPMKDREGVPSLELQSVMVTAPSGHAYCLSISTGVVNHEYVGDFVGTIQMNGEYTRGEKQLDLEHKHWMYDTLWETVVNDGISKPYVF